MSQTTPCRTCGATVAPDQRYCLSCGTRVAAPRLDFLAEAEAAEAAELAGAAAARNGSAGAAAAAGALGSSPAGPVASKPTLSWLDKLGGPMGAAAIALVSLGVGFLIGQATVREPPEQKAPVVNIQGGVPSGGTEVPAGEADEPATEQPAGEVEEPAPDVPAAEEPTGEAEQPAGEPEVIG